MRLGYRVSLAVISIAMVAVLFVSSSYALWKVTSVQENENIIKSGCFVVDLQSEGESIRLDNTYPMEDEKGLKQQPYVFTIKNNCTLDAQYTIYLSELVDDASKNNTLNIDLINYSFMEQGGAVATAKKLSALTSEQSKLTNSASSLSFEGKKIDATYELATGTLKGKKVNVQSGTEVTEKEGESKTYELRLWIDENATNEIFGKSFEAGVSAIAYAIASDTETP